ncbi:glycerophosphodiester phosphodiesterase [Echinicola strongylocentroti]|uniref:Glycerophosphodiester phosphodiesterase n=1 Tax=Echinicola strongylocentroti TaxID=1795355 RepID=A0A2Z4ICT4_9BACT|nr:glycerophosphodiester phosphodiesterase family protein [Echinicola strongylocentroti]AWW28772.1 glycerophosphodiester phosphodiesterase [Echinicola strongylocentroti]
MNLKKIQKCLLLSLLGLCLAPLVQAQVDEIRKEFLEGKSLMVIAHRASHQQYPENSIPAIQEAIDLGVDMVELDIRVTADGVPVIMHDGTVDRTTTGSGDVEQLSYAEIKEMFLLDKRDQASTFKIPTLKEALEVCKDRMMIDMDMKTDQVEAVLETVDLVGVGDQLLFYDGDWDVLAEIKRKYPQAYLMPRAHNKRHIKKAVKRLDPEVIHIDPSFYTPKTIETAEKFGLRIWINSLGDRDESIKSSPNVNDQMEWVHKGANMVQTDLPEFWVGVRNDSDK